MRTEWLLIVIIIIITIILSLSVKVDENLDYISHLVPVTTMVEQYLILQEKLGLQLNLKGTQEVKIPTAPTDTPPSEPRAPCLFDAY